MARVTDILRHYVSDAIARNEAEAVTAIEARPTASITVYGVRDWAGNLESVSFHTGPKEVNVLTIVPRNPDSLYWDGDTLRDLNGMHWDARSLFETARNHLRKSKRDQADSYLIESVFVYSSAF